MSTLGSSKCKPIHIVLICALICLGTGLFMAASAPIQAPVDAGIRYVDMHKVMVNSKFFKDRLTIIRDRMKAANTQLEALKDEYEKGKAALKDMLPGSKEITAAGEALMILEARMEYIRKVTRANSNRDQSQLEVAVYKQVRQKIADYAKIKGYSAILQVDEERHKDRKVNSERANMANSLRSVLWFNPLLDVTDDIIKLVK